MKKLIIAGLLGIIGWMPNHASAQISVNFNIGSQPLWGPVGYDYVDSYYLPDIECYYNVPSRQFIYRDNNRWIYSTSLPSRCRGYDLYSGYKVVVNSRDPYRNFDQDRVRYANYRSVRSQQVIRYSRDSRYYVVKGHPFFGRNRSQYESRDNGRRDDRNWERNDRGHDNRWTDRGGRDGGDHRGWDRDRRGRD